MKKAKKKNFEIDYALHVSIQDSAPSHCADDWRIYAEYLPTNRAMRCRLLNDMERHVLAAIKSGDTSFFRRFARFLERPLKKCPRRAFLIDAHLLGPKFQTFTHSELVKLVQEAGLYKNDYDSTLRDLKRLMKELGFAWSNSPRGQG